MIIVAWCAGRSGAGAGSSGGGGACGGGVGDGSAALGACPAICLFIDASAASDSKKRIAERGIDDSAVCGACWTVGAVAGSSPVGRSSDVAVVPPPVSTLTVARQLQHVNDVPPRGIRDVSI
jgi:hypothetical protein